VVAATAEVAGRSAVALAEEPEAAATPAERVEPLEEQLTAALAAEGFNHRKPRLREPSIQSAAADRPRNSERG
jgi:hypothetical protein